MKALLEKIRKLLKDRRFRRTWYRFVSGFAAVVVFITTYALVLPAITLEKTAVCGIEEHQHDESCYEYRLVCGQEESEGHHHDDSCYTVTQELVCGLEEHQHSNENGCYDEEGNLVCEIPEHVHGESCYKEVKVLTCGQEESEGHHHTDACYEKVLVCGKEAHIHSTECYKDDSSAVAATDEAAAGASTATSGESDSASSNAMPEETMEDGTAGMTEQTAVSDPSVPQLDPVNLDIMLTKDTGFYYFHAEGDEEIPANSAEIKEWKKVEKDTKLISTDLVKAYIAYKIPAGSLNESNSVARYRLPENIHLTDEQIEAINKTENGVYTSMDQETDALRYLGAEAVEGDRKPDEELVDGVQEYISAVVRAENVFDEEGQYLGQDLIFTFVPYTIEKNQNTYDADGSQLTAGEKITGWFACDFNMSQIDWVEEETELDNNAAEEIVESKSSEEPEELVTTKETEETEESEKSEKSAEVVFVEEDKEIGTKKISTVLNLAGTDKDDESGKDSEEKETVEYKSGTLTSNGDGYKITLDYTGEAKIPENAELSVREITPETDQEAYEACLEQAAGQVAGDEKSNVDQAASRFFDIEIVVKNTGENGEEGVEKIEPAAPVSVNIQIDDTSRNTEAASENDKTEQKDPTVLHFAEEGVEQIDSTVKDSKEQKNDEGQSTEVQFEAESFSIYGLVYTVSFSNEVGAKGDTWEIIVTYGEDAKIPYDAKLNVREILSTDEEYAELLNSAAEEACSDAEKQGIDMPIFSGARLFDIEIQGEGGKIEPAAPVQVSIRLVGSDAADHTSVVHFEEDGTKALAAETSEVRVPEMRKSEAEASEEAESETVASETQETAENDTDENGKDETETEEKAVTEISFQTDSFSVYSVVNVKNLNSLVNSGKKYALVSGIANDPGATTGYSETWGQDYFTIIVNAHAVSDQLAYDGQNRVDGLQVEPVHAYEDGSISYVGGSPTQWQFESAGNGKYYLLANGKYLQRYNKNDNNSQYGWEARLVDNRNSATKFSVSVNSDGTICIYDDIGGNGQQYYLHNDGNGEFAGRTFKFTNQNVNTNSAAFRFRVCSESDQFDSFAARKVSAQNLTVNDRFLIYRKFEDSQGNEQLYALASDGIFVRVYDGGDTVYWRETDKNVYWNYRLEGGYYCIYSTNPVTNETVYINPLYSSEPKRTITTDSSRLTLIGKDNGEYSTAIESWDQDAYDYAGLHVTINDQGQPVLSAGTRVAGTSDSFLFAVASTMPGTAAEKVDTVDSEALGIHITVYDYGSDTTEYSAGTKLNEMADVVSSDRNVANNYQPHKANALVKPYLESDLPSSKTKGAMTGLFTADGSAVKYSQSGVTDLFLKSYYDENGMFRYRSEDNFAYLGKNNNTHFTVYRQAATPYPYDTQPGHTYYTHGHYMPFNDIDMTKSVSRLMNQYGNEYTNNNIVGELPVGDGRTYENIYGTKGTPNFFTGMKMEADFTQLQNGRTENGDPMVFKFTGDDDMWVYIDGVLVLDIGGIHEPLSGTIDFATGQVSNPTGSSLAGTKTLYQIFMDVLNDSGTPQSVKDKINSLTWKDVNNDGTPDTFADYTNHEFKAFYMERGAGASNLDIQFNLKVVRPGEVVVEKQLPQGIDPKFVSQEYKFQATFKDYTDNNSVHPLNLSATYDDGKSVCSNIYYKGRKDEQGHPVVVPVDEDGFFTLKAGEAAVFAITDKKIEYAIKEVEIDDEKTQKVEINGQPVTVNNGIAEAAYARAGDRSQLNFKNHPCLQNLNIIKHLLPEGTVGGSGDVFEFRVYLESLVELDGEEVRQLIPYAYGPYYVTKPDENGVIHYYTLTGENNAPRDKGTTPVFCSTTGKSGSINSIPPEYTVVIPNLAVGTHFYIEERRDNIPAGYVFDHEDLVRDADYDYDDQTLGSDQEIISRTLARDEKDHQTFDHNTIGKIKKGKDAKSEIFNRKVNIKVRKQWLKTNGQPYTSAQVSQLPGSENAVITAELWRKKIVEETSGDSQTPVTVTFMVNTTDDTEYRQVSVPVTVKKDSTLEFSLGARGTSKAQEIHTDPEYTISRTSVSSNPKITYSNGRQKENWSKYTISGIAENTTVYATFDAEKVSDDFVGLYIASKEEPGASAAPVDEKVADITLNNGNGWLQQISMEQGYTYFLMNVAETGLEEYTHQYTFIGEPTVATDEDGNLILSVANKYREPINVTVEKEWSPGLTSEEEDDAYVIVELHRYAKKTKGVLEVVLKDNYGAPIEGAVFKLYKNGEEFGGEYTTDVNGKVTANDLEPGTYIFEQISTPEGYQMPDPAPQTDAFVVENNKTVPQVKHYELQNQALATNGVATLTLTDNTGAPIQGAKYNLIRREGGQEIVISEGLETDESGKITVSNLGAGTYYFFETEPPEDYKLPDYWQDTDFTVQEHPGTVQHFNLSMTNDLKGKGYVEITLTGPDGQPVSGAMFELYKGNEKLAENTTGSDGKLTFGDPVRLAPDTYTVRQVTSTPDLLPTTEAQEFRILENGDPNQKKELAFSNTYRGKGTATVTLTRKDNNNPISGATFELYKDGALFDTRTTDDNGQLTFGLPDNLLAGNYSIKQTSTDTDLEPVKANDSFAIMENGNPNQTHSWNVQNETEAGNVTIRLWKKQNGAGNNWNWEQLQDYKNLKPGRTYSFTVSLNQYGYPDHYWYNLEERESNHNRTINSGELAGLNTAGTWDTSTNTYHFTITPERDNTTYSYALVTDWNNSDIYSITLDESSRHARASAAGRSASRQAVQSAAPETRQMSTVKTAAQMGEAGQSDTESADSDTVTVPGRRGNTSAVRDVPQVVSPSGPPSADYIVDTDFTESYRITKADNNWKHVFENLDKCDQDENPYYYYVIETECVPDTYHLISYSNDNLSTTGTITVTNEIKRGALTIEKHVTVNHGAVPNDAKTIADGDYTFTVTGPNGYSQTATVTISQGQTNTTILNDLVPGTYTITETGTTNRNGVTLVTNPVPVTVAPDSQASANIASFTNDLETTSIKVKKQWMNANGSPVSNTSSVITFTLNQVSYVNGSDTSFTEVPYAGEYPHEIVGNDEVEITNLPVRGTREDGTQVNYAYTIRENQDSIPGYHDTYGTSDDGKEWTIYNTPAASTDQNDPLSVTKLWQDMNGTPNNGVHGDDEVTFTVTRHAVAANDYVPVTLSLFNSDSQGTAAQVKVYYVKKNSNVTLRFYNGDSRHFLTLSGAGSSDGRYIGEDRVTALYDRETTFTVSGPMSLTAQLSDREWGALLSRMHDTWVVNAGHAAGLPASTKWDYSISASGTKSIYEDAKLLAEELKGGEQLGNQPSYTYTMKGGDQITEGTDFDPQASGWIATLTGLPTYVKVGDHYETYTYTISEIKVNGKSVTYSAANTNQGSTDDYLVTLDPDHFTITNREKPVSIEFTKRWLNANEQVESWPDQTITVTVTGKTSAETKEYVYQIGKNDVTAGTLISAVRPADAPKLKVESIADNNYKFSLENLPRTDSSRNAYAYTISETGLPEGYKPPAYFDSNGDPIAPGGTTIQSGGTIVNAIATYELPYTGGPGTGLFRIVGSVLICLAGILLVRRRRLLNFGHHKCG